jgi:AcrR family transcriptional regulator
MLCSDKIDLMTDSREYVPSGTPNLYFQSATQLLATQGRPGVTIAALSRDSGVSSGSFYHHFGSWDGFVARFLEHWEHEQTERIVNLSGAADDPPERFRELIHLASKVPHATEAAIRAWAGSDPAVAMAQERVDSRRLAYLREVIGELVADRQFAKILASLTLSAFVGLELLQRQISARESTKVLAALQMLILSQQDVPG